MRGRGLLRFGVREPLRCLQHDRSHGHLHDDSCRIRRRPQLRLPLRRSQRQLPDLDLRDRCRLRRHPLLPQQRLRSEASQRPDLCRRPRVRLGDLREQCLLRLDLRRMRRLQPGQQPRQLLSRPEVHRGEPKLRALRVQWSKLPVPSDVYDQLRLQRGELLFCRHLYPPTHHRHRLQRPRRVRQWSLRGSLLLRQHLRRVLQGVQPAQLEGPVHECAGRLGRRAQLQPEYLRRRGRVRHALPRHPRLRGRSDLHRRRLHPTRRH